MSKPTPRVTMMHHATKRGFKDCPGFLNSTGRLGAKRGRKCYVTLAFSGVLNKGGQNQKSKPTLRVKVLVSSMARRPNSCTARALRLRLPPWRFCLFLMGFLYKLSPFLHINPPAGCAVNVQSCVGKNTVAKIKGAVACFNCWCLPRPPGRLCWSRLRSSRYTPIGVTPVTPLMVLPVPSRKQLTGPFQLGDADVGWPQLGTANVSRFHPCAQSLRSGTGQTANLRLPPELQNSVNVRIGLVESVHREGGPEASDKSPLALGWGMILFSPC